MYVVIHVLILDIYRILKIYGNMHTIVEIIIVVDMSLLLLIKKKLLSCI